MISKEKKQAIIAEYGRKPGDTGSPEVQIAILTARIQENGAWRTHLPSKLTGYCVSISSCLIISNILSCLCNLAICFLRNSICPRIHLVKKSVVKVSLLYPQKSNVRICSFYIELFIRMKFVYYFAVDYYYASVRIGELRTKSNFAT